MDLAEILFANSTYQDNLVDTKISFIAPSKLKLLSSKESKQFWEKSALL